MFRTIAKLLWAFEFSEALDESGNPLHLDVNAYTSGLVREPESYRIQVKPRSQRHVETIKKELVQAEAFLQAFD